MLYEKLQEDIKKAMIARDDVKRNCLRGLLSDVKNRTVNEGKPITDDAVAACAAKAVKMRREAIEQFENAVLSEDDTRRLVDAAVASGAANIGAVMKALPKNADRKFASAYARELFSKKP